MYAGAWLVTFLVQLKNAFSSHDDSRFAEGLVSRLSRSCQPVACPALSEKPPSTTICWPVMKLDSAPLKNRSHPTRLSFLFLSKVAPGVLLQRRELHRDDDLGFLMQQRAKLLVLAQKIMPGRILGHFGAAPGTVIEVRKPQR
jgi:hypothetical protein